MPSLELPHTIDTVTTVVLEPETALYDQSIEVVISSFILSVYNKVTYNATLWSINTPSSVPSPLVTDTHYAASAPSNDYVTGQLDALSFFFFITMFTFCARMCCMMRTPESKPIVVLAEPYEGNTNEMKCAKS